MTVTPEPAPTAGYARQLGLFSATMLVVGGIIGAGIFLNPAIVAQRLGSGAATMATWSLGALIAMIGAFVFAELGARVPRAGGGYVYLRDAFGGFPAFLYGWALFLMISTGAIAAVAMTFASYAVGLLQLPAVWSTPLALGAIVLLTVVNIIGVTPGAITQNVATVIKLSAIGFLIAIAFLTPDIAARPLAVPAAPLPRPDGLLAWLLAVGAALVPVLFAFGGWQQTNFVAEELRDVKRDLPRALVLGVLIVVAAYLLVNLAYLRALGVEGLAASHAPAADTVGVLLGARGRAIIGLGIAVSTFGFLNLVILVTPRVYQAMAADGVFFAGMARVDARTQTPIAALVGQAIWAIVLLFSGSYGQLLDYVVFADWLFFGATAAALFVFRARERRGTIPVVTVRTWGHPVTTLLFLLAGGYVIVGSIISNPVNALKGSALLALGAPAYAWWRRSSPRAGLSGSARRP
ncbi:MAG: amino acid permease [Gemmatimonadaceae bacterium]|nr:amino acid permease [Gemmatimonadaceae bacterium]